jgi:DNA-binding NarL/FixJ family response regulator
MAAAINYWVVIEATENEGTFERQSRTSIVVRAKSPEEAGREAEKRIRRQYPRTTKTVVSSVRPSPKP